MKFLLVVAIVAGVRAEADAEADPQLLYGSPLVYGLGAHHAIAHLPVVKSVEVTPAEVKTAPIVTYATGFPYAAHPYAAYPYAGLYNGGVWGHGLPIVGAPAAAVEAAAPAVVAEARKKREADADADPEADPYYLTYGLHHPYAYTHPVVKAAEVKTVEVKAPAVTYAYNHALPYSGYGYAGYPYGGAYAGAYAGVYGAHHAGVYGAHPYALGYHGYPYVVAKPAEAEEPAVEAEARKKRDADAEADPAILASSTTVTHPALTYSLPYATHGAYAGYGYPYAHGLGYATHGYSNLGYAGLGYNGLGYYGR